MKSNSERLVIFALYAALLLGFVFLYTNNPDHQLLISSMAISFTVVQIIRWTEWLSKKNPSNRLVTSLVILQLLLAFGIQMVDGSFVPQIYLFILIADITYNHRTSISVPFTIVCYLAFSFGVYIHHDFPPFETISFIIPRMLEYWLFFGFSYMAKQANIQSDELKRSNKKLHIATKKLEEKAIIEERIRLSKEIHDTVGHTLTTAIVGLEAGKQLYQKGESKAAFERFTLIQEQIKSSLETIRHTSKVLSQQETPIEFQTQLIELMDNLMQQTGITIKHQIDNLPVLNPKQQLTIYRALQEGLTNSIKHGSATDITFTLSSSEECLQFHLADNGTIEENVKYGLGLTSMEERIEAIKGTMSIEKSDSGGFSLRMTIPIHRNDATKIISAEELFI